jgi:hypothetical protein
MTIGVLQLELSIGDAMSLSNDSRYVEGALSKIVDFVRKAHTCELVDYQIELL